jgi:hypothetical protein
LTALPCSAPTPYSEGKPAIERPGEAGVTLGDGSRNVKPVVVHVEGDADHPINQGTLCPKGTWLQSNCRSLMFHLAASASVTESR